MRGYYDDQAGTPEPNQPNNLYVWKVPIPQSYAGDPIRYVVPPNLGADFTNTCSATGNALHVLAITDSLT